MWNWIRDNFILVLIGTIIALFIWFLCALVTFSTEARKEFMDECLKDHKKYECESLYTGNQSNLIIIPSGR